jgi:hypothetical protein
MLTIEDVCLIMNGLEEDWKSPKNKTRQPKEEEEKDKGDEELDDE